VRDDLLLYYERELRFLRRMGAEFAEKYPKIAARLQLEENKCEDPHVERLIESFGFLAARVHLKVDDQFPEITDALLHTLYPHYVRPIPSMSIVQFHLDPDQGKLTTGLRVPRGSVLLSRPVNGVPCRFRTSQETTVWPLAVANAEWKTPERLTPQIKAADAVAACRIELRGFPDVSFSKLGLETLRVYLSGDGELPYALHELLLNNTQQILIRDLDPKAKLPPVVLPASAVRQAGFTEEDALLPYPKRSFRGYRLMQEYFSFPQKFLFLDIGGFDAARVAGFGRSVEVIFLISQFERFDRHYALENGVNRDSFRLSCSPAINLFPQTSEPILLHQRSPEYLIVPDARRRQATEAFSVEQVSGVTPDSNEALIFESFYSYRHSLDRAPNRIFWYTTRRPSGWATDGGTDLYLSLVDLSNRVVHPDADAITCRLLCFNRDLPSRLPFGNENGDFELEGGGPIRKIISLVKPTDAVQPPLGRSLQWRLISQLSLNYLSLVEDGVEALQEILRVQNFNRAAFLEKQIQGIAGIQSRPAMVQMASENGISFARGRRVEIEFDEEQFAGGGVFLFSSLLEQFFEMYVSLNSFVMMSAKTKQRKEVMKEWPPRAGGRILA
jgi:type VI secretion system protein ImpG